MMKKATIGIGIALLVSGLAFAESQEFTVTAESNQTAYSSALNVHGYIDRIELEKTGSQSDVVIGTFTTGNATIDTFVSVSNWEDGGVQYKVIRPRLIGTTTDGTALAAAVGAYAVTTNSLGQSLTNWVATTTLQAQYEKPLAGGNVKVKFTNDATGSNVTTKVVGRIYFEPVTR